MEMEKIETYKKKLEEERAKLMKELGDTKKHEDFGEGVGHSDEEADEAESLGEHLAIGQSFKERISEIDAALNKIIEGKYGACEKCGKKIEEEILNLSPESRFCHNCKKENKK